MKLTQEEKHALASFAAQDGVLLSAVAKFNEAMRLKAEANCADAMRSAPRQYEIAADYASKAEAYKTWLPDLERFAAAS